MAGGTGREQLTDSVVAVVVALVSAISGLLYGYDTGIISGALLQITARARRHRPRPPAEY